MPADAPPPMSQVGYSGHVPGKREIDFTAPLGNLPHFQSPDTKLGQGRDAVKTLLADNPELMEELETKIKEALRPTQVEEVMPEEALA